MFSKLVGWINRLYPSRKRAAKCESRFENYLEYGVKEGRAGVISSVNLCDEALDIVSDRIALINRLTALEERMAKAECYGRLSDAEANHLKNLLARHVALVEESDELGYQLTGLNRSLIHMERMESEARQDLPEIQLAEERQRTFKRDLSLLEGEQTTLELGRDRLRNAIDFVRRFSVVMILVLSGATLVMVFLHVFRDAQMAWVLLVTMVLMMILSAMLYALRNRLKSELSLNCTKLERTAELVKKKTVVHEHFTNYLDYEYRKFCVKDGEMLANNLSDYGTYKQITRRLEVLRDIMEQTETAIYTFFRDKGMEFEFSSIEQFAATLDVDDKKVHYKEMSREKSLIEKSLVHFDTRSAQIWDILMALKASEKQDADIIGQIIEEYVEKAEHILNDNGG